MRRDEHNSGPGMGPPAAAARTAVKPAESRRADPGAARDASHPAIAFLTIGSFSRANQAVREIIGRGFPEHTIEDVDVAGLVRRDPLAVVGGLIALVASYGPGILLRKGARWRAFFGTPWAFRMLQRKIRRQIASGRYTFTFQTQSLFDGHSPGVPHFVYTDHTARMNRHYPGGQDRIEARLSEAWMDLEADIYRNATRVFTQTRRAERSVVEDYGASPDRVECVFAGSHVRARPTAGARPYAAKRILYVGTSWTRKGGPELVRAFEQVRARHPDAELVLVGPAPRIDVPNVRSIGSVPPDVLATHLEEASIFCVPTRREPLGFVFIEAADHGLPIVSTRVGSLPELVVHGETGSLVEVGDVDGLAAALIQLLDDPERCRRYGERGRAHLADTWTWDNVERLLVPALRHDVGDTGPVAEARAGVGAESDAAQNR